ncbi:archaea-specific SMC-related protein [Halalkalicoccus sp. NIPERK01]|uniref:archaea-specific SMC-related protein n=1 Tax=Halalkalicoccus sp. NIPERK01 TaxID=3053469 RepID=UPI00256F641A|nr:archaea-specific SMC-related protein [Halalkalicoccus sp. NIPERK01]MDL5360774.1 chromosome segregation protein SMC [Halalkalicoccus sp. NIPERK01]
MSSAEESNETKTNGSVTVRAEKIGGIDSTSVELDAGVTALAGRNATNRTSFLQAIMAALGSDRASLKGDAERGRVEMDFGGRTYTRTLARTNGTVAFGGEPYLDQSQLADLFAFLLESNEARRAVVRGDDLRELILRPVDVGEIEATIERLQAEKRGIDEELSELSAAEREHGSLEEERARLEHELESVEESLTEAREALADEDSEGDSERFDRLREAQTDLEDVTYDLDTERASVESLEAEREEVRDELSDLTIDTDDLDDLAGEIERLRGRKRELDETVSQLQTVIQFNEDMVDAEYPELLDAGDGNVTDQLLADREVTCWTCGSSVETDRIEETLSNLRELRSEKVERRNEVSSRLESLTEERAEYRQRREERDRLERTLSDLESELTERRERIDDLEERSDALRSTVEQLESEIEADEDETLDAQKAVTRNEVERDRLRRELDAIDEDLAEIEDRLAERDGLKDRREEINEELEQQRTRIERLEREAIGAFNEHMETVLGLLEYANLERIWIERLATGDEATFELHVTRSTGSGTTYEDSVDHLSESEREVTGLIVALAGYLVHEVYEHVPFMLLDSLEALDSERIAALVEYLEQYAPYIVVALLPEDAAALDDDYPRITEI